MSLLELKHRTPPFTPLTCVDSLLQYITDLAYVSLCKLDGRSLARESVVDDLIQLRVVLEKLRPVEHKVKYQIEKMLRYAAVRSDAIALENDDVHEDPSQFKPNPELLLASTQPPEEEEVDHGKLYRAPRIAPVSYSEDMDPSDRGKRRQAREQERLMQKASRSRIMRDLLNEFDDQPEEETATGGAITMQNRESKAFVEERERQEYEEDNFIRLTTTKKELKRRQKDFLQTRIDDELQNMNDFSSLSKVRKEDDFSLMSRKQRVSENFQPDELLTDFNEFQHQRKRVVKQKKHQHNKRRKH